MNKLFIIFVLGCHIGLPYAQISVSKNPPEDYDSFPFGHITTGQEKQEMLNVIDQFMIAVNTKSKKLFDQILYKGIQRIVTQVDAIKTSTTIYDNDMRLQNLASKPEQYKERYWDALIVSDGNIASVWAPYDFYLNDKFSHCGVDLFYLVKEGGAWKIAHFGYTIVKDCKKEN